MVKVPCQDIVMNIIPAIQASLAAELVSLGITQVQAAKALSVAPSAVSQYLSGKRGYRIVFEDEILTIIRKLAQDITEDLREEVVLGLPSYPKCEISGLECEINDTFGDFRLDKDPHSGVDSATPSGESVWDALDKFPRE